MQYRRRALGAALASSTSSSPLDSSCLLRVLQLGEREREREREKVRTLTPHNEAQLVTLARHTADIVVLL
jgi:hypothetical protein